MRLALLATLCLALLAVTPARAEPPLATRTLQHFDFEERAIGNVEDVPMGWLKVAGPGLPHYLYGRFDTAAPAHSGRASFRYDLNGGSVTYRYPAGRLRVTPGATYRVEAVARTTPLAHARAVVTTYFADVDGRPLLATLRRSAPYAAPDHAAADRWHPLAVDLVADDPLAHSLVVELGLLQPTLLDAGTLGDRQLRVEDIRGTAWFDDVRVAQVPRIHLTTPRAGNVFLRSDPVRIGVRVEDRVTADLTARLVVSGADGREVFQRTGGLDLARSDDGDTLSGTVALPDLAPGWYEARLSLASGDHAVGERVAHLVKLADDDRGGPTDPRFGFVATDLPPASWAALPDVLEQTGAGRVKLAVWSATGAVETGDRLAFDALLEQFAARDIELTACLAALPPAVRTAVGGEEWTQLLKAPPERWQPQLAFLVARHANRLRHWQLLPDEAADRFATDPELRRVHARVLREFDKLIGSPDLTMPWPAWFETTDGTAEASARPASVTLTVPPEVLPEQLPLYVADLRAAGQAVSLSLRPIDPERYGRPAWLRDLALRLAYALVAGADRVDVPLPLAIDLGHDGLPRADPGEAWPVMRTLMRHLGNATCHGRVPLGDGVDAYLFERPDGEAVLLAWTLRDVPQSVAADFGPDARRVDCWGRSASLAPTSSRAGGEQSLTVEPMPTLVVGIDAPLMRLRASVALDDPLIESTFATHGRELRLTNPYPHVLEGSVRLTAPRGWTVSPATSSFALAAGATLRVPVSVTFPSNVRAGEHALTADLRLEGAAGRGRTTVPVAVRVGLGDVGLQTLAFRDGGGQLVVQQIVTNYGRRPIDYTAFVLVPGQARQERLITALPPSQAVIRRYRFAAGAAGKARSGLRELDGSRVLNEEVVIP